MSVRASDTVMTEDLRKFVKPESLTWIEPVAFSQLEFRSNNLASDTRKESEGYKWVAEAAASILP